MLQALITAVREETRLKRQGISRSINQSSKNGGKLKD